ncbi:MAG: DNA (cytosine-5-)-methyltransferase [Prochloraceae cyanobacterium]|nr:DNA (cytosine-5-)-methyltransferase [Prochloraceae cyanobacterium]
MENCLKFIDLFAGLGGMRIGLEAACKSLDIKSECVLSSEIKSHAIATYKKNFQDNKIQGDINRIATKDIPDFDILLAGFPCQPFSTAGKREGFLDTRGTLFFEIERILQAKSPFGFILEKVEGLVKHDRGRTLSTIINNLQKLGYQVTSKVLNAVDFGIPQNRKRIYIVGNKFYPISLDFPITKRNNLKAILQRGYPTLETEFVKKLLERYSVQELIGKAIKDKRGAHILQLVA